jgi:hypothetical protein
MSHRVAAIPGTSRACAGGRTRSKRTRRRELLSDRVRKSDYYINVVKLPYGEHFRRKYCLSSTPPQFVHGQQIGCRAHRPAALAPLLLSRATRRAHLPSAPAVGGRRFFVARRGSVVSRAVFRVERRARRRQGCVLGRVSRISRRRSRRSGKRRSSER